jgi:hypothetical protein
MATVSFRGGTCHLRCRRVRPDAFRSPQNLANIFLLKGIFCATFFR